MVTGEATLGYIAVYTKFEPIGSQLYNAFNSMRNYVPL
jgi:hypothetical protein